MREPCLQYKELKALHLTYNSTTYTSLSSRNAFPEHRNNKNKKIKFDHAHLSKVLKIRFSVEDLAHMYKCNIKPDF